MQKFASCVRLMSSYYHYYYHHLWYFAQLTSFLIDVAVGRYCMYVGIIDIFVQYLPAFVHIVCEVRPSSVVVA